MQPWELDPFVTALRENNVAAVENLLSEGRTVTERFHFQRTALHVAAEHGANECASFLLARGEDMEAADEAGWTPLIHATQRSHVETVALLAKAGARIKYTHTPEDTPEIREKLRRTYEPFLKETLKSNSELTRIINDPEYGMDMESFGQEQVSSLIEVSLQRREVHAVHHCNDLATLQLLVEKLRAAINVEYAGYWPLKSFAESGNTPAVAWLLERGAKPDFTSTGDTALHAAVAGNHLDCALQLLQAGANPNQQDVDGWVPLARIASLEMLELLVAAGADPNIADQCDYKPSYWIKDHGLKERLLALERRSK